jgi:hypothetical protein
VALVKIILQFMVQDLAKVVGLLAEGVGALILLMEITPEMVDKAVVVMAQPITPQPQQMAQAVGLVVVALRNPERVMALVVMVVLVLFLLEG